MCSARSCSRLYIAIGGNGDGAAASSARCAACCREQRNDVGTTAAPAAEAGDDRLPARGHRRRADLCAPGVTLEQRLHEPPRLKLRDDRGWYVSDHSLSLSLSLSLSSFH